MTLNATKVGFNILIKHSLDNLNLDNLNLTGGDSDDGAHCPPR